MRLRLVFIINLILILSEIVVAQPGRLGPPEKQSEPQEEVGIDSLLFPVTKLALEISVDYGKAIESLITTQTKWEFGLGVILKDKIAFTGEYGYGSLYPDGVIQNGSYEVTGNYYRVGAEYIFTVAPKRFLSLGGMFASSTYSDKGLVQIESELWPDIEEEFARTGLNTNWVELILNTQGPIINAEKGVFSNLYWGVRFRLRILITDLSGPGFEIYAIPGYGKTYSDVLPAANLFLRYRLNF